MCSFLCWKIDLLDRCLRLRPTLRSRRSTRPGQSTLPPTPPTTPTAGPSDSRQGRPRPEGRARPRGRGPRGRARPLPPPRDPTLVSGLLQRMLFFRFFCILTSNNRAKFYSAKHPCDGFMLGLSMQLRPKLQNLLSNRIARLIGTLQILP